MNPKSNNSHPDTTLHQPKSSSAGLYIHVPFCLSKCPYCDFFSTTNFDRINPYIKALTTELTLRKGFVPCADSIYFGGGTPSVLTYRQLEKIMDHLYGVFSVRSDAEVTLEVNPGTVSKDELYRYRAIGINRLNIGLQSLDDLTLRFLGRIHSADQGIEVYQWSREAGFENVGLDLIYGVPGQSLQRWENELADVVALEPDHLSCYTLTLEAETPMAEWVEKVKVRLSDEKMVADLFSFTSTYLKQNRYDHYEISNFAHLNDDFGVDMRSHHNRKYWNLVTYLGFGPAAHSYHCNTRWWNHRSLDAYLSDLTKGNVPVAGRETLSREQQMIEFIYLGLRQKEGFGIREFSLRFATNFYDTFGPSLKQLFDEKLIDNESGCIRLTEKGFCFHESVVGKLLA